ncbi:MAG: hypothetical protein RIF32_20000 [Leptospirales bacterium]|jgi:hypothetical protein
MIDAAYEKRVRRLRAALRNRRAWKKRRASPGLRLFVVLVFVCAFDSSGLGAQETESDGNPAQEADQSVDVSEIDQLFAEELENSRAERREASDDSGRLPAGVPEGNLLNFVDRNQRTYTLDILAAVDMVGEWDNEEPDTTGNEFAIREVELGFFADIDQLAQGVVLMAAHNEGGEFFYEVHEAYFNFPRFFVPNLSARAGQMFFDVGRLNATHRHDWKFTQAPVVHEELLDEEAAEDTGLELSYLMPWPFWQELTLGVFNGKTFGHSHVQGPEKNNPLYTAHLPQFFSIADDWGTQFGFSYLRWHPTEEANRVTHQYGFDFLLKWVQGHGRQLELSSEVWYRETREKNERRFDPPAAPIETRVGGYVFAEYRFHREWGVGYRYDYFTNPNFRDNDGRIEKKNGIEQNSVMVTYYPSEFSYFRATAERETILEAGDNTYQFYLQADFIIGRHPPHKY